MPSQQLEDTVTWAECGCAGQACALLQHWYTGQHRLAANITLMALLLCCCLAVCVAGYAGASCGACPKGEYSVGETAKDASVSCALCPAGKTTVGTNSTLAGDCNSKSTLSGQLAGPAHASNTQ